MKYLLALYGQTNTMSKSVVYLRRHGYTDCCLKNTQATLFSLLDFNFTQSENSRGLPQIVIGRSLRKTSASTSRITPFGFSI